MRFRMCVYMILYICLCVCVCVCMCVCVCVCVVCALCVRMWYVLVGLVPCV